MITYLIENNIPHSVIFSKVSLLGSKDINRQDAFMIVKTGEKLPSQYKCELNTVVTNSRIMSVDLKNDLKNQFKNKMDSYDRVISDVNGRVYEFNNFKEYLKNTY